MKGMRILKFFIEVNNTREKAVESFPRIREYLNNKGQSVVYNPGDADIIVSLGGDGTLIETIGKYHKFNIPFLGINCGNLGYLTEIDCGNFEEKLNAVINKEYRVKEHCSIECKLDEHNIFGLSFNDIYLRNNSMNVMDFDVYVNGRFLSEYKADGIIISTPVGSTGYSLSCGGAFIDPDANVIILTMIAPHTIMNRSIVLNDSSKVEIVIKRTNGNIGLAMDGFKYENFKDGQKLTISKSKNKVKLIEIGNDSFISRIAKKLNK